MTLDEFKEHQHRITEAELHRYENAKVLFEKAKVEKVSLDKVTYVKKVTEKYDLDLQVSPQTLIETLEQLKKDFKSYEENLVNFYSYDYIDIDVFDTCIDETYVEYTHYVLYTEEEFESSMKRTMRQFFDEKLKPDGESYEKMIDCKLLQLFSDGAIDWETLQKLVYSNCKI